MKTLIHRIKFSKALYISKDIENKQIVCLQNKNFQFLSSFVNTVQNSHLMGERTIFSTEVIYFQSILADKYMCRRE